ncbi:alpha/beta hydrolase [Rhodococcus sp. HNM0563]|uniref:alpha/beta hydrolase n=1 Tax=Rhodococcus sp. HNM0563 TaxID=2716339 RepID=UPI00146DFAA9|nr:alpha/beta hydrolase [Rhodococcus sp. HNM0563]NLU64408.1 alpha/beta hydrolase [Rhodococcus sp. HNM0563]
MSSALSAPLVAPVRARSTPQIEEYGGVSIASRALSISLRHTVRPLLDAWALTPSLPWPTGLVDRAAFPLLPAPGTEYHRMTLDTCPAEFVRAPGAGGRTAILYLHGGAFLCCGLTTHRQLVSRISAAAGAPALSVAYRMLPRHPIRHAVDDGLSGLRWLIAHGYPIDRIVIAGDSAGGFLAFSVAHEALRLGLGRAAGTVAISPLTDLDHRPKLDHPNARKCALFPRRAVPALSTLIERAEQIDDRYAPVPSPVDLDLTGMPPALLQTGSEEMTFVDAETMAYRLASAGVPTQLQVWEKQAHVFQAAASLVPEGSRAIVEIGMFVRSLDTV